MRCRAMSSGDCAPLCDRVKPNPDDRIGAEFVGVAQKVRQQRKLHKVQHRHLDDLLVVDLLS